MDKTDSIPASQELPIQQWTMGELLNKQMLLSQGVVILMKETILSDEG